MIKAGTRVDNAMAKALARAFRWRLRSAFAVVSSIG